MPLGIRLPAFFPDQLQSQMAMLLQLLMNGFPIGFASIPMESIPIFIRPAAMPNWTMRSRSASTTASTTSARTLKLQFSGSPVVKE